jgi:prepilin-type N-terminal cleavage/methylation domain-containing protein
MRRTKGFTLIELLVVVAIIGVLAALLVPVVDKAREKAKQAACVAGLNAVGKAFKMYNADEERYPVLAVDGDPATAISNTVDNLWSGADGATTLALSAMNNVWVMIAHGEISGASAFKCPSDKTEDRPNTDNKYGWSELNQFSYDLHYPYQTNGGTPNPVPIDEDLPGGMVIMGDKNPGTKGVAGSTSVTANGKRVEAGVTAPSNHKKDGGSVLRFSGSVKFYKSVKDSECGSERDDIYITGVDGSGPVPITATTGQETDTFLVPSTD